MIIKFSCCSWKDSSLHTRKEIVIKQSNLFWYNLLHSGMNWLGGADLFFIRNVTPAAGLTKLYLTLWFCPAIKSSHKINDGEGIYNMCSFIFLSISRISQYLKLLLKFPSSAQVLNHKSFTFFYACILNSPCSSPLNPQFGQNYLGIFCFATGMSLTLVALAVVVI